VRAIAIGAAGSPALHKEQPDKPSGAHGETESAGFYPWSTIAIPCAIFTLNVFFYHYFFVMCPFVFVLLAVCRLSGRRAVLSVLIAQAVLSLAFLTYIHWL
jgi:hypothetical protein